MLSNLLPARFRGPPCSKHQAAAQANESSSCQVTNQKTWVAAEKRHSSYHDSDIYQIEEHLNYGSLVSNLEFEFAAQAR